MSNEALRLADAARIAELEQELDRLQGNYLIAFERGRIAGIAELEKEALAKPFAPDWAGYRQGLEDGKREGQAERDRLRAEVERQTRAMKVIYTWAGVPGALNPEHVRELCGKALGKDTP